VRVPLFIYDSDAPGGTIGTLVNVRDLPATMLDWQQATPLLPQDGRSLVPLYRGTATDWYSDTYISHLVVTGTIDSFRPWRAVRQDCALAAAEQRHCPKVVRYLPAVVAIAGIGDVSFGEEWEVYLLDEDPWELTNVHANALTGYPGVPGWDDSNPELAAAKTSLALHQALGR
jgi:arylsulfatase A-like enzyme